MLAAVNGWFVINVILILVILYMVASWGYIRWRGRQLKGALGAEAFEQSMRKSQLIDLRDAKSFKSKHILGARSMPYTQIKQWYGELRPDLPVYLYEDNQAVAIRAALYLKKKGFTEIKWLESGFQNWTGKTKTSTN